MTSDSSPHVAVVGAGVTGLTSAYRLLEAGYEVTVFGRDLPPNTTSDRAAAFWSVAATLSGWRSSHWALESLRVFRDLAAQAESGVDILEIVELSPEGHAPMNVESVEARPVPAGSFPAPWGGFVLEAPRVDVPTYMPWLLARIRAMGGKVEQRELDRLEDAGAGYDVIVNSSGLGARELVQDEVFPIRGQVMLVSRPPNLPNRIVHASEGDIVTYIVPRRSDVLLGGTYQYYDASTDVDAAIATGIFDRCAVFAPSLRDAEVLDHRVGLRPGRASVRLEREQIADGRMVVHNYGHGSVGHTLSWGCAADVVELVRKA